MTKYYKFLLTWAGLLVNSVGFFCQLRSQRNILQILELRQWQELTCPYTGHALPAKEAHTKMNALQWSIIEHISTDSIVSKVINTVLVYSINRVLVWSTLTTYSQSYSGLMIGNEVCHMTSTKSRSGQECWTAYFNVPVEWHLHHRCIAKWNLQCILVHNSLHKWPLGHALLYSG